MPNQWLRDVRAKVETLLRERGASVGVGHVESVPPDVMGAENSILYLFDRSGTGVEWHMPVRLPREVDNDAGTEAQSIVDAWSASQIVRAMADEGPFGGSIVPFASKDHVTRVVRLKSGEPSLILGHGNKLGVPLGTYRYEDAKAIWVDGEL